MKNLARCLGFVFMLLLVSCGNPSSGAGAIIDDSEFRVVINIDLFSKVNVNAYVYDENNKFLDGAIIKIDGVTLDKQTYDGYYKYLDLNWDTKSEHSYSVKLPGGLLTEGSIIAHEKTLVGVTCSPSNQIVNKYTLTPPNSEWPPNSYVECSVVRNGNRHSYFRIPTGIKDCEIDIEQIDGVTEIEIRSSIQIENAIPNYDKFSVISVKGLKTKIQIKP